MATPLEIPNFKHIYSGKVRDLYKNQNNELLVVASDRISAFDWVLPSEIVDKGKILTKLSIWWFQQLLPVASNHLISTQVPEVVKDRAMLVKNLEMFPVEAVVRGYLTGSALIEYQENQKVCGNLLPNGLREASKLTEPIYTPATKAELGNHDENIDFAKSVAIVGPKFANEIKDKAIEIYLLANKIASAQGVIIADTKFEFGHNQKEIILADEVLTPDSSRFWPKEEWQEGQTQNSFDKQFVRNWLLTKESQWDKNSNITPPKLPSDIIEKTRNKYLTIYERLTGEKF